MEKSSGKSEVYQAKQQLTVLKCEVTDTHSADPASDRGKKRKLNEREAHSEAAQNSPKLKKLSLGVDAGVPHRTRADGFSSVRDSGADANVLLRDILLQIKKENAANRKDNTKFHNSILGLLQEMKRNVDRQLNDIHISIQENNSALANNGMDALKQTIHHRAAELQESESQDGNISGDENPKELRDLNFVDLDEE